MTNPPVEIAAFLACVAFLVVLINGALKLTDRVKGKPTAGEVRSEVSDRYLEKSEFQQHQEWNRREHENLFRKIGGVERGAGAVSDKIRQEIHEMELRIDNKDEERSKSVHERLNELLGLVSAINERTSKR